MHYEVKSRINWLLVLSELIIGSIGVSVGIFYSDFNKPFLVWLVMITIGSVIIFWRMQSYKIVVEDGINFKRVLFPDYKIAFEEIVNIKLYEDDKSNRLSLKHDFLEIDTKNRYYTYHLDHFDLKEINELLIYISTKCEIKYHGKDI